ncbi:hypothetical protein FRC07_012066 [Ceratobasidium sp. 392]|nr:hypothetical protein FRC07_012066 [Ceratobasidium sp. 392]
MSDTYPFPSVPPSISANSCFPPVISPPIPNPSNLNYLLGAFDGVLESVTVDKLYQNPWAGRLKGVGGSMRRNSAGGVSIGESEPAIQTGPANTANTTNPGVQVESGPCALGGNVEDFAQAEKRYIRRVSKGQIIYQHPTAGRTYGKGQTRWQAERKKNKKDRNGNPYGMWASKDEWEAAKWMATEKVSQSSIDKLLKTECYKDAKYTFKNAKTLFKKIRDEMGTFGGPEWHAEDIALAKAPKDKVTLLWKDIQECGDFQFGQAQFAGKMSFGPEKHYDADDINRLFENPWTADHWGEIQDSLPTGTTWGGMLFASDSTILSMHSGDVAVHTVYMTLANIEGHIHTKIAIRARNVRVPTPTQSHSHETPRHVEPPPVPSLYDHHHRPLRRQTPHDVVDPAGNIQSVLYGLAGYIADLEEQWLVAGLGGQTCPHCEHDSTHLGDHESGPPRTRANFLEQLDNIKESHKESWGRSPSLEEYMNLAGEKHFNGVDKPFWRFLPGLDIFHALSPDLLHGFHKFFHDHI